MTQLLEGQAQGLADKIARLSGVEAVVLAGSLAAGTADKNSDIDLYVYASPFPTPEERQTLAASVAQTWEVNNQFWETEDLLILNSGTKAEIIWRDFGFIQDQKIRTLDRQEAWVGYTTCFWSNLLNSRVLVDKTGRYTALQETARQPYPEALAKNIIAKNLPLLAESLSSYAHQTAQAEDRGDLVTVNHRVAAFLASWFDILFAVNRIPHPGEKKQVMILKTQGRIFPQAWEEDLTELLHSGGHRTPSIVMTAMDQSLRRILK